MAALVPEHSQSKCPVRNCASVCPAGSIQFLIFELSKGKWTRDISKFAKVEGQESHVTIGFLLFYNKAVRILFHWSLQFSVDEV